MVKGKDKCRICGSDNLINNWWVVKFIYCSSCHTAWPRKLAEEGYGENYYQAKLSFVSKLFLPLWKLFYLRRNIYVDSKKINRWIDVGAGDGGYLEHVKANEKIGVEISQSGRKIMKQKGIESISDKKFLESKKLNADVISFWHMLEHTKDPEKYLIAANKNLKKGGRIVVGLPNIDSFEFWLTRNKWFHIQPGYHEYLFSEKTIKTLFKKTGFRIMEKDYWSIEHHPTGILQSMFSFSGGSLNLLHKLVKRQMRRNAISTKDFILIVFWLTIGIPVVVSIWVIQSLLGKSGTMVVVASPKP